MFKKSNIPWNKGMTKFTDERIMKYSKKVKVTLTGKERPYRKTGKEIKCINCYKIFYVPKCYLSKKKFCSKECFTKFSPKFREGKTYKEIYGIEKGEIVAKNISKVKKGKSNKKTLITRRNNNKEWFSKETKEKMSNTHKELHRKGIIISPSNRKDVQEKIREKIQEVINNAKINS